MRKVQALFSLMFLSFVVLLESENHRILVKSSLSAAPVRVDHFGILRFGDGLTIGSGGVTVRSADGKQTVIITPSTKSEVIFLHDKYRLRKVDCVKNRLAIKNLADKTVDIKFKRYKSLKPRDAFYIDAGIRFEVLVAGKRIFRGRASVNRCVLAVFGSKSSFYDVRFY